MEHDFRDLLIVNRHFDLLGTPGSIDKVLLWNEAHSYADRLVLVDDSDKSGALEIPGLNTLRLTHWADLRLKSRQRWAPALNAAIAEAALRGYEYISFISSGAEISPETMDAMLRFMRENSRVRSCGPRTENHPFYAPGAWPIAGSLIPWNQSSLNSVKHHAKVWYQGVSDGLLELAAQGVEEVISHIFASVVDPDIIVALLDGLPGAKKFEQNLELGSDYEAWATDEKFPTKSARPQRQIELMGPHFVELAQRAKVWHVNYDDYLVNGAPWLR